MYRLHTFPQVDDFCLENEHGEPVCSLGKYLEAMLPVSRYSGLLPGDKDLLLAILVIERLLPH